jgi:suppressor of fused
MSFLRRLFGRDDDSEHHHSDEPVPGWDAISAALEPLYGDEEPLHWGTIMRWRMGGPDPLDGVSAYRAGGPPPHWHYVSYGLSELYAKESDDPDVSGWGLELTFRLVRMPSDREAPVWPVSLMQNLARYIFESGNVLAVGDHLDLNGPIAIDEPTNIRAVAFAEDEQLGTIETPHGSLTFVQIVGLTIDEYEAAQDWDTSALLEVLRSSAPLLATDLSRTSMLSDAGTAATVRDAIATEGSSMGGIHSDDLEWTISGDRVEIALGATAVPRLLRMLRGRLPFDRPFSAQGPTMSLNVSPGEAFDAHDAGEDALHMTLSPADVAGILAALRPIAGSYEVSSRLAFDVRRSVITDQQGREVEVVG